MNIIHNSNNESEAINVRKNALRNSSRNKEAWNLNQSS